jgi:hypothetical protein
LYVKRSFQVNVPIGHEFVDICRREPVAFPTVGATARSEFGPNNQGFCPVVV